MLSKLSSTIKKSVTYSCNSDIITDEVKREFANMFAQSNFYSSFSVAENFVGSLTNDEETIKVDLRISSPNGIASIILISLSVEDNSEEQNLLARGEKLFKQVETVIKKVLGWIL